jgi:hypothetical protein
MKRPLDRSEGEGWGSANGAVRPSRAHYSGGVFEGKRDDASRKFTRQSRSDDVSQRAAAKK